MDNLVQQLRNINIQPSKTWKQDTRDFLLSEISSSQVEKVSFTKEHQFQIPHFAWKPVGIFVLIAGIIFSSGTGLTMAAKGSKAGDSLFAIKRVMEKVQISIVKDNARKVVLANTFADHRVAELRQTLLASAEDNQKIDLALNAVKQQVEDVQTEFNNLKVKNIDDNQKVVATALDLNKKISFYKKELNQVKDKIKTDKASTEINQVLDDVKQDVLAVLVEKHNSGQAGLNEKDITTSLEEHIVAIKEKADEVSAIIAENNPEDLLEIKTKIEEADKALADNEYNLFLTLAKDSNEMLKMLYGEVNEVQTIPEPGSVTEENTDESEINVNENKTETAPIEDNTDENKDLGGAVSADNSREVDTNTAQTAPLAKETSRDKTIENSSDLESQDHEFEVGISQ